MRVSVRLQTKQGCAITLLNWSAPEPGNGRCFQVRQPKSILWLALLWQSAPHPQPTQPAPPAPLHGPPRPIMFSLELQELPLLAQGLQIRRSQIPTRGQLRVGRGWVTGRQQ